MKLLHISRKSNRHSIMTNGILPSYVKLDHHYRCFKGYGLEDRKCVYTWNPDQGQSTEKYIRDMVYCKLFIHPRNDILETHEKKMDKLWGDGKLTREQWEDNRYWLDMSKYGKKLFGSDDEYDLYEIDIEEEDPDLLSGWFMHGQERSESKSDSCHLLDDYYAHDDKTLHISKGIIIPNKIKIVETVKTRVYSNDTVGFTHRKYNG